MKIAVLGSATSWYVGDLRRAAGERHRVTPVTYSQLASKVTSETLTVESGEIALNEFDALLVRSMPPGSLEQVVFRMDALARLEAAGVAVINSAKACETAIDKYLTTARLQAAGLKVPDTFVCQTAEQGLEAFERLGGEVVVKPLFGGEGRGITKVDDPAIALRVMKTLEQLGSVLYLQKFIPHRGHDLRLLVIGERIFGMRRSNPDDWRTNVALGAQGEPLEVTPELAEVALQAVKSVGADIAGVDLLPGRDGQLYVLEVNAVPGWRALNRVTGVDVARHVLDFVERRVC
ncbi:ATP-grasp domain-containing protein [Adhaeretor mobilis]|uniref:Alpha-aminoadipate--LysW ligase LysX n=1 Tax=Adhaeretor mobilis TaxID=1930276 RepID=A0A517MS54_9BACT|nr:RimK family alpha-L-glutamate ligase [Adhaeretor mobilis]QDS97711.1 Alpha-aminoadipate--LysW ligase LysX [Adhaeretor mobilis]